MPIINEIEITGDYITLFAVGGTIFILFLKMMSP